jgi:hypothetical protein
MTPMPDNLRTVVGSLPISVANRVRDIAMGPDEIKAQKELMEECEMIKTAAIVTAVCFIVIFAAFPNFFTGLFMAFGLFVAYETSVVVSNMKRIFDDFSLEARCGKNKQTALEELSKNTFLARHVISLAW